MLRAPIAVLLLAATLSAGPLSGLPPGVVHGLLAGDGRPLIFLAPNDRMTLAYDLPGGSLLYAWKGRVIPLDHGATAPSAPPAPANPAPSPRAVPPLRKPEGLEYHRRDAPRPWTLKGPNGTIPVTVTFSGSRLVGNLPAVSFILRAPGVRIRVEEVPMFDDHYGDEGLFRKFAIRGIPPGHVLRLDLSGRGLPATWGGGGDGGLVEEGGRHFLEQGADGETPLKVTWSAAPESPSGGPPVRGGTW